jgi:hypothetical protein
MSIPRRLVRRRRTPDAFSKGLRLRFRVLELIEPREPEPRGDARESLTHQHHVRAHIVAGHHVGEPPVVDVEPFAVAFEPHKSMEHQTREPVTRGIREGRGRVEDAADLRRVDPEQTHAPEPRDINRVAIEHGAHKHELGSLERPRREGCNQCHERGGGSEQKLHRDLLCQRLTRNRNALLQSVNRRPLAS